MSNKKFSKLWEALGKGFFDMGKLTFGSLVLGAMLRGEIEVTRIFLFGVSATALLFIAGAILTLNSGE